MARIIDLKNRGAEAPKPENGRGFIVPARPVQDKPRLISHSGFVLPQTQNLSQSERTSQSDQNLEKNKNPNPAIISWSAQPDRQPNLRLIFAVSLGLFAIATLVQIFDKNIITTVFFALLGAVLLFVAPQKRGANNFEINPLGIMTDEKLLGYREIKSFWIEYDPALGIKELSLQLKKWYMPFIEIPLGDQNPVQVRAALIDLIPEIEHQHTLVETLARRLGL